MGYGREVYAKAVSELELRREKAINDCEKRKNAVFAKSQRAAEIEQELGRTAIKAGKAVLSGGNVKANLEALRETNEALLKERDRILFSLGCKPDYFEINYKCKNCGDKGFFESGNRTVMCSCLTDLLKETAIKMLNGVSPLSLSTFHSFSLEYYSSAPHGESSVSPLKRMEDILRFCKSYADDFSFSSPNLLMQGATGLGKTHLSLAIAGKAVEKGFGVVYVSAPDILSKLEKEHFSSSRETEGKTEELLVGCDLLVLDDLGTEFITSFSTTTVHNIFNKRILLKRPTIISTNLSMQELEKVYTSRFVSRIIGSYLRLQFLGSDVRQKLKISR